MREMILNKKQKKLDRITKILKPYPESVNPNHV